MSNAPLVDSVAAQKIGDDIIETLIAQARQGCELPLMKTRMADVDPGPALRDAQPLCPYEISSLAALIEHISGQLGRSNLTVRELIEIEFSVESIAQLRHVDFRHAVSFLFDLLQRG
jgi:hypothetical protein